MTNDDWGLSFELWPFWSVIARIIFANVMTNILWGFVFIGILFISEAAKRDAMYTGFDYDEYCAWKRQVKRKVMNSFKSILSQVTK